LVFGQTFGDTDMTSLQITESKTIK